MLLAHISNLPTRLPLSIPSLLQGVLQATGNKISEDEKVYFEDFLNFYRPFELLCYDEKEILCEKIRAILTRRGQKLRDFYDVFLEKKVFPLRRI